MKNTVTPLLKSIFFTCLALWPITNAFGQKTKRPLIGKNVCLEKLFFNYKINPIKLNYAIGFEIYSFKKTTILRVKRPWIGSSDQFIFIGPDLIPSKILECKKNGLYFPSSISKMASISTTHLPFIEILESLHKLKGFSGAHYISSANVRKKISEKKIKNLGYPLNIEKVLKLNPEMLMAYTLEDPSLTGLGKLKKLGQKIVFNGEFREVHPLGRFEWIKFVGALLGKQQKANTIFNQRKNQYLALKRKVSLKKNQNKPFVLVGKNYQGSWNLPGYNTYFSKLLKDAGAKQPWDKKTEKLLLPLNFESILKGTNKTIFWLPQSSWNSKKEILKEDPRYALLNPFKKNNIFTNNNSINSNGGNDYWEGALVNPHLLLKDLVKIFHPKLLPTHNLRWYKRIL